MSSYQHYIENNLHHCKRAIGLNNKLTPSKQKGKRNAELFARMNRLRAILKKTFDRGPPF